MIPFELSTLLLLALLGGAVAIDGTSFGQFMLSRPFIAATLAGALVGNPAGGAIIGLVLEAFHLNILPVGAAKYPEGGPAAVAGGAVYASSFPQASALLLTVLMVLALEWIGGETVRYLRQANMHLVPVGTAEPIDPDRLERRHLGAILCDYARGMVLVFAGVLLLFFILRTLTPLWAFGERVPQAITGAIVAGLLASSIRVVGSRGWMAAAGAAAGLAFLLFAR